MLQCHSQLRSKLEASPSPIRLWLRETVRSREFTRFSNFSWEEKYLGHLHASAVEQSVSKMVYLSLTCVVFYYPLGGSR